MQITGLSIANSVNGNQTVAVDLEPATDTDTAPIELHDALDRAWRALIAHLPSAPAA